MKLDGNYYYMDSTWSGSTYDDGSSGGIKYINYNYFALTEKDFDLKHTPSDIIDLPTADSMDDNYYVKEGLYITDWNENSIGNLLEMHIQTEIKYLHLDFLMKICIINFCQRLSRMVKSPHTVAGYNR